MFLHLQFEMHGDVTCLLGASSITSEPKVPPILGEEASGSDVVKFSAGWRPAPCHLLSHSCSLPNGFLSFHHLSSIPSGCLCPPWQFCLPPLWHSGLSSALRWAEGFKIFVISKFHCANKIINPQRMGRFGTFQNRAAFVPEVPIENSAWTLRSLGSFIFWEWTMDPEYFILASTEFTMPVLKQSSW